MGFFKNLKEIFGQNIFLWWIPIYFSNNNNLKGYSFEINEDCCKTLITNDESKSFHTSKNNSPTDNDYNNYNDNNDYDIDNKENENKENDEKDNYRKNDDSYLSIEKN